MPLFRRKPQLQDEALRDLSEMFFDWHDDPTPGHELLDASKLDFSVESLAHVDDYLEAMSLRELSDRDRFVMALRSGAYVGEVIRRNLTGLELHWLDYDGAVSADRRIKSMGGKSLALMAVLWDGRQGFIFPIAKVLKFLSNGRGDSTHFFASATIALEPTSSGLP